MGKDNCRNGYTLIELVIAMSLSAVLALVSAAVLISLSRVGQLSEQTGEEKVSARILQKTLSRYLSGALNTDWTNSVIDNVDSGRGKLRIFRSGLNATSSASQFQVVGLFLREEGFPSLSQPSGDVRATAMYFKNPKPKEPGELRIVTSPSGHGAATLAPSQAQFRIENILEFEVSPGGYRSVSGDAARIVRVRYVYRRFSSLNKKDWRWCPQDKISKITACQTKEGFKDIEKIFQVTLFNNALETTIGGGAYKENILGDIYFFNVKVQE